MKYENWEAESCEQRQMQRGGGGSLIKSCLFTVTKAVVSCCSQTLYLRLLSCSNYWLAEAFEKSTINSGSGRNRKNSRVFSPWECNWWDTVEQHTHWSIQSHGKLWLGLQCVWSLPGCCFHYILVPECSTTDVGESERQSIWVFFTELSNWMVIMINLGLRMYMCRCMCTTDMSFLGGGDLNKHSCIENMFIRWGNPHNSREILPDTESQMISFQIHSNQRRHKIKKEIVKISMYIIVYVRIKSIEWVMWEKCTWPNEKTGKN